MIQNGFQRLVLLGSAGYQRAELPLDDSVSLIAPNNTGKTSLINALQFLLIIDRRRMDFGAHEFDKTRRFYFPSNSAYILLEVSLAQSGTVVLGCVGKGVSHDYEYFAYQGPLDVNQYRLANGTLVTQSQLANHLAGQGRVVYHYTASEFRELIYGGRRSRSSGEPDFTVFHLEHATDAQAFQTVLTRTLRLDKLSSADVKTYLLQIFKRDLPDASIDFKQEWDKAFSEVNAERLQYQAAQSQLTQIETLAKAFEECLTLRGKLIDWRPRIEQGLTDWQDHYQAHQQTLTAQAQAIKDEQGQQTQRDRDLTTQHYQCQQEITKQEALEQEQHQLAQRFGLVQSRRQLEQQLADVQTRLDAQTTRIGQASSRNPTLLRRDQHKLEREWQQLEQQRTHLDHNLYRQLSEQIDTDTLDRLNRVLSVQVLTLGPQAFQLDAAQLQAVLNCPAGESLELPGLYLDLSVLSPQHQQRTEAELTELMADTRQQLDDLAAQLEVAEQMEQARQKKVALERELRQMEAELTNYDRLQTLQHQAATRQHTLQTLRQQLGYIEHALTHSQQQVDRLRQQLGEVERAVLALNQQHHTIARLRDQRIDHAKPFTYLAELDHHPWLGESEWRLETLDKRLRDYQHDGQRICELDRQLDHSLRELHAAGLTKYRDSDSRDQELARIIDFSRQLPQEAEALEKKARSAVVNVTASLRELRDGLLSFQRRMREFNRLIGHRQLSDLKTFKIEPQDETHLVEAITTLIDTAAQIDTGDTFELFNQSSVLDDAQLKRARQVLVDEGNARQGLKVADLFRLEFVVGKIDQPPEAFGDIDSAASNGTVLMAKLVTGLAMLHLMQNQRHTLRAVCYLDEALSLDARNQTSLIETAREFGFALIFASPAPLTTARYCVPIQRHQGHNHISRQSWQILEVFDEVVR